MTVYSITELRCRSLLFYSASLHYFSVLLFHCTIPLLHCREVVCVTGEISRISGVHSIMMEKLASLVGGGGRGHSHIYHHVQSCSLRSSWQGRYTPTISTLPPYVLCGYTLLWYITSAVLHLQYLHTIFISRELLYYLIKFSGLLLCNMYVFHQLKGIVSSYFKTENALLQLYPP